MAVITTTVSFASGDQVTSDKLNEITTGSAFTAGAVTGTTLAVVGGQLKVDTITAAEMGALSVSTGALQDASVTTGKIADGAATTAKYANLSITADKIANGTLTLPKFSSSIIATRTNVQNGDSGVLITADVVGYAPGAAKSYGGFAISSSSRTIRSNSFNFSAVSRISSTQTQVTFLAPMNSPAYAALVSLETDGSETGEVAVYDREGSGFKIRHPSEASGRAISFSVFGKLA